MNRITFIYIILHLFINYTAGNITTSDTAGDLQKSTSLDSSSVSISPTSQAKGVGSTLASGLNKVISTSNPVHHNTSSTSSPDCVCDGVLLPRLGKNGKELEICPECKCKHEARNTTLIKVVVIIVIWIISILVIYMLFLMCLDPLLNKRVKANYQEHTNEDDDTTTNIPPTMISGSAHHELNSRSNVLNRVGHQQDKWKRQVLEQRRHIYDRRTMLN